MNRGEKYEDESIVQPGYITGDLDADMLNLVKEINDAVTASIVNNASYKMQKNVTKECEVKDSTAYYALSKYYDEFLLKKKLARKKPGEPDKREYLPCVVSFLNKQEAIRGIYNLSPSAFIEKWNFLEESGRVPATQVDQMVDRISTEVSSPLVVKFQEFGFGIDRIENAIAKSSEVQEQQYAKMQEALDNAREEREEYRAQFETVRLANEEMMRQVQALQNTYTEKFKDLSDQLDTEKADLRKSLEESEQKRAELQSRNEEKIAELQAINEELLGKMEQMGQAYTTGVSSLIDKVAELDDYVVGYKKKMFSGDTWKENCLKITKEIERTLSEVNKTIGELREKQ